MSIMQPKLTEYYIHCEQRAMFLTGKMMHLWKFSLDLRSAFANDGRMTGVRVCLCVGIEFTSCASCNIFHWRFILSFFPYLYCRRIDWVTERSCHCMRKILLNYWRSCICQPSFCQLVHPSFDSLFVRKRTARSVRALTCHFKRRKIAELNERINFFLPKALTVKRFKVCRSLFLLAAVFG
jgi:hypothetical protein